MRKKIRKRKSLSIKERLILKNLTFGDPVRYQGCWAFISKDMASVRSGNTWLLGVKEEKWNNS